ncbi:PQQ-dependent sugar dehydrogenase [Niabella beijingensis]|uniref:PQQ-dependent sugar dehydrogenase n=1 Tax=Niabella beijingensis TaxID=2872700 RepID=UPI001CBDD744|nr:PQQ-dependent sugar dehydrogenase [Niabella beijingensis]MBZ4189117.1 PQQ-dependent sugar dehydrogenase [Niabella beijingensis]
MQQNFSKSFSLLAAAICGLLCISFVPPSKIKPRPGQQAAPAPIKLPQGFTAHTILDSSAKARDIVVTPQGIIYVKLSRPKNGKAILVLKERADGKATVTGGFGNYSGTGLYLKNGYLFASSNEAVFRYQLNDKNEVINPEQPETVISGLKMGRQHETKSIVLDNDGNIYVNIGFPLNSCQEKDRQPGSLGIPGCPLLDSAGGIWQFSASKLNQSYPEGTRYATGLRNVVGMDWNQQNNTLFVMQHGRDQLHDLFPDLYTQKQSAELPAECMYRIKKGDNAGFPFIYYDPFQKKKIQAPEYGGDGKKEGSAEYIDPVVAFPAHLAPNGLLFYTGNQFPEKYRNGAFVAFHGSWNRTPEKQEGFMVAFVPFRDGKPSGEWEVFADGFAGVPEVLSPRQAQHRPCGLAQGSDGSLYVTDDVKGTIYKIEYKQ